MMRAFTIRFIIVFLASALLWLSCGGNGPSGPQLRSSDEYVEEGWRAFEGGEFKLAVAKFDSAKLSDSEFAEGYNGAGWAFGVLAEFDASAANFEIALELDENLLEASAGAALAFHGANRFRESIERCNHVLDTDSDFIFAHDPSIDALDIRITLTLSYFSVAEFELAAAEMNVIDPAGSPHSTQPEELILEIMRFFRQIR